MNAIVEHVRSIAVAYVALFFALGMGTAWAVEVNSVKSKHIVDGQVKGKDVADDSLKGVDIDETSLDGVDEETLDGADTCTGSITFQSSTGGPVCLLGGLTMRRAVVAAGPRAARSRSTARWATATSERGAMGWSRIRT